MTTNKRRVNKAPQIGKSHINHSKEVAVPAVLEKELLTPSVKKVVSRLKKVRKAHKSYAPAIKAEVEPEKLIITKHKLNSARSLHKGHLNTFCYWAGAFISDCAAAFTSQKEKTKT